MKKFFHAFLVLGVSLAHAQQEKMAQLTTRDGREYKDVTIVSHDAVGIKINHAGGVGRIAFERLPLTLQKKYKFDFSKAEEQKKLEQQQAIATEQAIVREMEKKGTSTGAGASLGDAFDANELSVVKIDGYITMMRMKINDAENKRQQLLRNAETERSRTRTAYRSRYDSYGNRYTIPETVPDKAGYGKARQYEKEAMALLDSIGQAQQLIASAELRKRVLNQSPAK